MRKVVSTDEGFSFFINDEECVFYKTGIHMSGQEIGDILNLSRNSICLTLKKSIKKTYYTIKRKHHDLSTIEIICGMAQAFNIKSDSQYKKFFKMFPENIRREVYEEAHKNRYI